MAHFQRNAYAGTQVRIAILIDGGFGCPTNVLKKGPARASPNERLPLPITDANDADDGAAAR